MGFLRQAWLEHDVGIFQTTKSRNNLNISQDYVDNILIHKAHKII